MSKTLIFVIFLSFSFTLCEVKEACVSIHAPLFDFSLSIGELNQEIRQIVYKFSGINDFPQSETFDKLLDNFLVKDWRSVFKIVNIPNKIELAKKIRTAGKEYFKMKGSQNIESFFVKVLKIVSSFLLNKCPKPKISEFSDSLFSYTHDASKYYTFLSGEYDETEALNFRNNYIKAKSWFISMIHRNYQNLSLIECTCRGSTGILDLRSNVLKSISQLNDLNSGIQWTIEIADRLLAMTNLIKENDIQSLEMFLEVNHRGGMGGFFTSQRFFEDTKIQSVVKVTSGIFKQILSTDNIYLISHILMKIVANDHIMMGGLSMNLKPLIKAKFSKPFTVCLNEEENRKSNRILAFEIIYASHESNDLSFMNKEFVSHIASNFDLFVHYNLNHIHALQAFSKLLKFLSFFEIFSLDDLDDVLSNFLDTMNDFIITENPQPIIPQIYIKFDLYLNKRLALKGFAKYYKIFKLFCRLAFTTKLNEEEVLNLMPENVVSDRAKRSLAKKILEFETYINSKNFAETIWVFDQELAKNNAKAKLFDVTVAKLKPKFEFVTFEEPEQDEIKGGVIQIIDKNSLLNLMQISENISIGRKEQIKINQKDDPFLKTSKSDEPRHSHDNILEDLDYSIHKNPNVKLKKFDPLNFIKKVLKRKIVHRLIDCQYSSSIEIFEGEYESDRIPEFFEIQKRKNRRVVSQQEFQEARDECNQRKSQGKDLDLIIKLFTLEDCKETKVKLARKREEVTEEKEAFFVKVGSGKRITVTKEEYYQKLSDCLQQVHGETYTVITFTFNGKEEQKSVTTHNGVPKINQLLVIYQLERNECFERVSFEEYSKAKSQALNTKDFISRSDISELKNSGIQDGNKYNTRSKKPTCISESVETNTKRGNKYLRII